MKRTTLQSPVIGTDLVYAVMETTRDNTSKINTIQIKTPWHKSKHYMTKAKDKEMIEQTTLQGSWHGLGSHCHRKKTHETTHHKQHKLTQINTPQSNMAQNNTTPPQRMTNQWSKQLTSL